MGPKINPCGTPFSNFKVTWHYQKAHIRALSLSVQELPDPGERGEEEEGDGCQGGDWSGAGNRSVWVLLPTFLFVFIGWYKLGYKYNRMILYWCTSFLHGIVGTYISWTIKAMLQHAVCSVVRRMRGRGCGQRGGRFQRGRWARPGPRQSERPPHPTQPPMERPQTLTQYPREGDPLGALANSDPGQSVIQEPARDKFF